MSSSPFCVLEYQGGVWGLAHRSPHFGPYPTEGEARAEIDRYSARWPEDDASVFAVFRLEPVGERAAR